MSHGTATLLGPDEQAGLGAHPQASGQLHPVCKAIPVTADASPPSFQFYSTSWHERYSVDPGFRN